MLSLATIKQTIRQPYVWPGGYPLFFIMTDGEPLSVQSAKENFKQIAWAHINKMHRDQWGIIGLMINWENAELVCSHSGEPIESAYGYSL
jgi:hypothetical protein